MGNITLNNRLKELRNDLKMNQSTFAETIGITQSTLSSYENGNASPSNDVLLTIAKKFNISLDWLFGISQKKINISSLGDVVDFLFSLDELNELRFEFDINDHLPNDLESDTNKWYASLTFYGNDKEHNANTDLCQFLRSFYDNRENVEHYFTDRELYEIWQGKTIESYSDLPLTKKVHEILNSKALRERRDAYLKEVYTESQDKKSKK
jgi:transcriptional regulator with XRE-family HTH domain